MAVKVNPPPTLRIPDKIFNDPELRSYFEQERQILFQLWQRSGGSLDLVAGQQIIVSTSSDFTVESFSTLVVVTADIAEVNITLPPITDSVIGETVEVLALDTTFNINVIPQSANIMDDTSVIINQQFTSLLFTVIDSNNWYIAS